MFVYDIKDILTVLIILLVIIYYILKFIIKVVIEIVKKTGKKIVTIVNIINYMMFKMEVSVVINVLKRIGLMAGANLLIMSIMKNANTLRRRDNMKEYNLNIKIYNIKVDERYYSFDYIVKLKGKELKGNYENDYCNGMTKEEWEKYLKNSDICLRTILEDIAYDLGE